MQQIEENDEYQNPQQIQERIEEQQQQQQHIDGDGDGEHEEGEEEWNKENENQIVSVENKSDSLNKITQVTVIIMFIHYFAIFGLLCFNIAADRNFLQQVADIIIFGPVLGWGIVQVSNTIQDPSKIMGLGGLLIFFNLPNIIFIGVLCGPEYKADLNQDALYSVCEERYAQYAQYGLNLIEIIFIFITANMIKKKQIQEFLNTKL